mmetsp:Transcript_25637/g.39721  ORF Transcript_25637/g.39721 Transcript_25637/m.39721 type:complete len:256 (-) Transcript_25637:289-1056(-)|eukprot:CAMPEP_0196828638 /NCGR_PEP_ID=MMETSP1362-20130617/94782_1 /TAXON_ID=163516 /ORGANISM="Leptocylindrus danicus, Strain CCMP1856" /LENGTH=255 /DNA_ID=CAMNT_0042209321 /DNA_START=151 /DNA_END=918 /DNA_ORIENTATION=-
MRREELDERYELYGWTPKLSKPQEEECSGEGEKHVNVAAALSDDENYMDLVMLITRNSTCRQGHMGCILVNSSNTDKANGENGNADAEETKFYNRIIGAATNCALYTISDSDVHAEVAALGDASSRGNRTKGCTAYITMAPCKKCFGSLFCSGVSRIVSRQALPDTMARVAEQKGIEYYDMKFQSQEQDARIAVWIQNSMNGSDADAMKAAIVADRERRKEINRARKEKRKATLKENIEMYSKQKKQPCPAPCND